MPRSRHGTVRGIDKVCRDPATVRSAASARRAEIRPRCGPRHRQGAPRCRGGFQTRPCCGARTSRGRPAASRAFFMPAVHPRFPYPSSGTKSRKRLSSTPPTGVSPSRPRHGKSQRSQALPLYQSSRMQKRQQNRRAGSAVAAARGDGAGEPLQSAGQSLGVRGGRREPAAQHRRLLGPGAQARGSRRVLLLDLRHCFASGGLALGKGFSDDR